MNQVAVDSTATNAATPTAITTEFLPNPTVPADRRRSSNSITDVHRRTRPRRPGLALPRPAARRSTRPRRTRPSTLDDHQRPGHRRPRSRHGGQSTAAPHSTVQVQTPSLAHRDRKINLNFPLPVSNDPAEPVRQKWIRETYQILKAILPPAGGRHPRGARRAQPVRRQHHRLPRPRLHDDPVRQHRPDGHRRPDQDRLDRDQSRPRAAADADSSTPTWNVSPDRASGSPTSRRHRRPDHFPYDPSHLQPRTPPTAVPGPARDGIQPDRDQRGPRLPVPVRTPAGHAAARSTGLLHRAGQHPDRGAEQHRRRTPTPRPSRSTAGTSSSPPTTTAGAGPTRSPARSHPIAWPAPTRPTHAAGRSTADARRPRRRPIGGPPLNDIVQHVRRSPPADRRSSRRSTPTRDPAHLRRPRAYTPRRRGDNATPRPGRPRVHARSPVPTTARQPSRRRSSRRPDAARRPGTRARYYWLYLRRPANPFDTAARPPPGPTARWSWSTRCGSPTSTPGPPRHRPRRPAPVTGDRRQHDSSPPSGSSPTGAATWSRSTRRPRRPPATPAAAQASPPSARRARLRLRLLRADRPADRRPSSGDYGQLQPAPTGDVDQATTRPVLPVDRQPSGNARRHRLGLLPVPRPRLHQRGRAAPGPRLPARPVHQAVRRGALPRQRRSITGATPPATTTPPAPTTATSTRTTEPDTGARPPTAPTSAGRTSTPSHAARADPDVPLPARQVLLHGRLGRPAGHRQARPPTTPS